MNHVGTYEIKGERVVLRPYTLNDVDEFYDNYGSDPKVQKYFNFAADGSREASEAYIKSCVEKYDDPAFYAWAVLVEGKVVGGIALSNIDEKSDAAELQASLGSEFWWKGFTTESARIVKDLAFNTIGIHRLYGMHHVDNVSHGSMLIKVGMEPEGVLKEAHKNPDGSYSNAKLYAVCNK